MSGGAADPELQVRYRWHPHVASRVLEGVAFVLLSGRMLRMNAVGTRMWELFEHGATIGAVAEHIVAEFETTPEIARRDTTQWVKDLVARALLVADSDAPATTG